MTLAINSPKIQRIVVSGIELLQRECVDQAHCQAYVISRQTGLLRSKGHVVGLMEFRMDSSL